jgi:hypothetical protein
MSRALVFLALICCLARAFAVLQPTNLGDDELSALACDFTALYLVRALPLPHVASQAAPAIRFRRPSACSKHASR